MLRNDRYPIDPMEQIRRVTVTARRVGPDAATMEKPGRYWVIEIVDTGHYRTRELLTSRDGWVRSMGWRALYRTQAEAEAELEAIHEYRWGRLWDLARADMAADMAWDRSLWGESRVPVGAGA